MSIVKTKDLDVGMTVRYPSASAWRVTDKKPAEKDSQGPRLEITLMHGRQYKTVTVWEWFTWITVAACEARCKLTGEHTGR